MKKLIRFVVTIVILAGLLFLLKPNSNDFENWVKKNAAKKRGNAKGDNVIERLVDKGATTATQLQILATYRNEDHILWTIVEATANGEKLKYIGIAKIWIPLQIKTDTSTSSVTEVLKPWCCSL